MEVYQKRRQRLVRNTWWFVIAFFAVLLILPALCRGEDLKPYHPAKAKESWTIFVNYLMTQQMWRDSHDNEMYHETFSLGDDSNTLSYNHTNGTLSMTIVQLQQRDTRIVGNKEKVSAYKTKAIVSLTMISFNFDTVPDIAVKQEVILGTEKYNMLGCTTIVDGIPQGNQLRKGNEKNLMKQLAYLATWAMWEVHIMEHIGYTPVIPEKKEKM